jgi:peptidoglycan/LPS O-acetylase OafA/YrhL
MMVLGHHCEQSWGFPAAWKPLFEWLFYGRLGVRFFFVLSGFLITLLMLRERARTGRFSLTSFWIRRSLRILPVYYCHLAVLAILQHRQLFQMSSGDWVRALTFTYNYGAGQWLPGHIWSLCVEEQFYLVWPVLFLVMSSRPRWMLATLVAVVGLAPSCRVMASSGVSHPLTGWASLLTNMDLLAIGCFCAWLVFRHGEWLSANRDRIGVPSLVAGLLMILVPYVLWKVRVLGFATVPFGPTLQGVGFAVLMCLSVLYFDHWSTVWLRIRPVEMLGVLSYSIYVWQQLVCSRPEIFGIQPVWFLSWPFWVPLSLGIGAVSYFAIEAPFLRLKRRF